MLIFLSRYVHCYFAELHPRVRVASAAAGLTRLPLSRRRAPPASTLLTNRHIVSRTFFLLLKEEYIFHTHFLSNLKRLCCARIESP